MTSENTHAVVSFHSEQMSSGTSPDCPPAPIHNATAHKNNLRLPTLLFASTLTLLLKTIFLSAALIKRRVCWSPRLWITAVVCIVMLSACFIVSCVVIYHFTSEKSDKRLSELHTYHSGLTCFSEGTRVTEKVWGCCPSTWKSFGSSCYFISTEQNFWHKSEQKCVEMGGHLVVINTEAEQNFIVQQLNKTLSYFLGLSDPQGNNNWQWIDHTPFEKNVRFWHEKEPNFSAEQCASIVYWNPGLWGWNDVFCDTKRNSICEMKKIYL